MTRAVLTFHSIDDSGSVLSFPARAFAMLLSCLRESGVPVLPFSRLREARTGVTITFDDGMRSVAENALPVLRDLALPSHLFLTTSTVGRNNRWASQPAAIEAMSMMDWPSIEACASAGMTVECHTATHPDLRRLPAAAVADECTEADELIERRLGRRPTMFAYPYGHVSELARAVVADRYVAAFTAELGYLSGRSDTYRLPRIDAYYLRPPAVARRLMVRPGRAYIWLRGVLRQLRRVT